MLYSCGRPTFNGCANEALRATRRLLTWQWGFDVSSARWSHILTLIEKSSIVDLHILMAVCQSTWNDLDMLNCQKTNKSKPLSTDPLGFPGPVVLPTPFSHFDHRWSSSDGGHVSWKIGVPNMILWLPVSVAKASKPQDASSPGFSELKKAA